jgi:hypothetical protein
MQQQQQQQQQQAADTAFNNRPRTLLSSVPRERVDGALNKEN